MFLGHEEDKVAIKLRSVTINYRSSVIQISISTSGTQTPEFKPNRIESSNFYLRGSEIIRAVHGDLQEGYR